MAQEILLPVKVQIENLQSIAKDMRSQLGTLKIDSSGYKKLESVIVDIEKRIQQLQVISSRPFVDAKQFTSVSKEIVGIQDDITKIGIEARKVKFSDLSLDASQKAKLQDFDQQIKSINDQLKQVKESAKSTFLDTDAGKAWKIAHPKEAAQSFTQITKAIETEINKQEAALKKAEAANKEYQDKLAARRELNKFIKNGHGLTKDNLGEDLYNQIFNASGNFKTGGKTILQTWLEEQFKLDPSVAQNLTKEAGNKVRAAFAEASGTVDKTLRQERNRIDTGLKEEKARTNNGASYAAEIAAAQTSLTAENAAKEAINQTNLKLSKTEEELANSLRKAKLDREQYTIALTQAAAGQLQMGSSCSAAQAQLQALSATVDQGKAKLASLDQATGKLQGISNFVNRYVGAYAIIRKVSTAIRNAFSNIKDLDKVITSIAVVTNMSQEDLWNKVGQYTQMAQEYGVATKDVYTVSQIFYQQGLQTSQVMDLTTETLKMAKIAGMEYSAAANAMTVAVRAFKIEMTDAQQVTDTYSALAAKFAVSSAEIANAMEKTASSAASVGMSLESTSAFISVMEQTTRESAQNIGSALKSIISRYGEMKASPDKLINVDGEEVAFNKVDTALSSIGISIKDAAGQFRDFDDVIMELASKWDALDNNTQRYIATVMAGNRQQSRFIALVSNYDELKRAMATANDAENASIVQVAKTMDSLESKANQLKNAFSQIYLDLHVENGLKDIYDWLTRILKTMAKLGTLRGVLPTLANIVGLGTGTKSLLKAGMNLLQEQKGKYQIETQDAEDKIKSIREEASKDIVAKYKIQADLSELEAQKALLQSQMTQASQNQAMASNSAYKVYMGALPANVKGLNQADFEKLLKNPEALKKELQNKGINEGGQKYITEQAEKFQEANNAISQLTQNIINLDSAIKALTGAKSDEANATEANTTAEQQETEAKTQQTSSTSQVTDAQIELAQKTGTSASELELLSDKQKSALAAKQLEENASRDNADAKQREAAGSKDAEIADHEEASASRDAAKASSGGTWAGHETAMKVTGLMTSVARLAGTAITALGAAHQDKSTDTVEMSKIYTGLGNGLSMAGTGASMGMVFGPWGAALGAIGGFLVGGLGALLDGAQMSLEEKLALQKQEAKKASDEALKKQAAATDLNSQIQNLETLRKAMYNSNEDMQKYTDAMNTMAGQYPTLVSSYDAAGNAIIDLNAAEVLLAETRASASAEASKAARLEARARATTIETLESAHSEVVSGQKRVYETYTDNSGKQHAFFSNGQWSDVLNDLRSQFGEDVDSWNLNQIIDGLNRYNGNGKYNYISSWRNIFNSKAHIDQDSGAITLADDLEAEMSQLVELHNANTTLKNRATDLNITAAEDVDSELAYVYGFMGWDSSIKITAERIKEFDARLSERIEGYEKTVDILDASLPILDSQEALDYALLSKDTKKASKISTSKVAAKLIANQLEAAAKQFNYDTAADWSKSEDADAQSAYTGAKTTATNIVVDWLTGLTETELDNFLTIFGETNKYFSVEDMFNSLGYKSTEDFTKDLQTNYGLDPQQSKNLLISLQKSFADSVQSDRDRILKTVYAYDENGNRTGKFNDTGLAGISKINGTDQAQSIADRFLEFDGASEIISQYADYFTNQLVAINKLATDGYTELAQTRLNSLYELSTILTDIDDSKVQRDLFTTISTIDFSNYDSLVKAQKSIESYQAQNGKTVETDAIIAELINAQENLIFNLNTLAQGVTEKVTAAAKEIDGILSTNSSGMDLSKAVAALDELNTGKTGKEALSFNEALRFDTELGKYIYTVQGLDAAIAAQETELNKEVTKLQHTQELYNKGFSFTEDAPATFTEAQDIIDSIQDYNTMDADSKALYQKLAKDFITATSNVNDLTQEKFVEYVSKQAKTGEIEAEKALALVEAYKENKPNIIYSNIDWSKIASNTDYGGENRELMQRLIEHYEMDAHAAYQEVIKKHLDSIYGEGESPAKAAAQEAVLTPIIDAEIKRYQDAISEILDPSARISVATEQVASKLDIGIDNIRDSTENAITAAQSFLNQLATQIGQGSYTIESYNNDAKSILDKTLGRQTQSKAAMDFISSDITGDSLQTLANALNLKLTDIVDVATGQVKGAIGEHLKFNVLTGKYDITSSFDEFIDAMNEQFNIYIMKGTKQYTEALKAFNDTEINEYDRINKNVSEEINKVLSAKGGQKLNLAQTFTSLSDKAQAALAEVFNANGADFAEGILTIKEGANIAAIAEALAQKAAEEGLILQSEFDSLVDAINDLLSSITSSITSGITGKLSASKARDLQTWAKNNGLGELDFTRTKDGLKLSQKSAQELYDKLKDIDSISAQIVLDELNKSIEESVTSAKELQGTMKEVAELRATTESDDFKFMDNKIPSGQNNPINYLNNWSEAFKKMNEAGKASGKMKNKMDYSDFYNIITEMGNLAQQTGEVKLSGDTVLHNMEDAAALIEKGAAALSIAADGSIKVDLSKLGIDFSTGAKDLKANVGKGIQEVAQSQVEMLDSMIQLLETIVAMEKLGDIDVEGNGIDFNEMFKAMYDDRGFELNTYEWTEGMQKASKDILDYADSLGKDSDLYKGLDNVVVNGTSMRQLLEKARDNIKVNKEDAQAYHAAVKAFYEAMRSGNYDLDSIMASMKEVLAGTGFEGEIKVGDMTLTFHYGQVITKTEAGKYVGGNGKEYTSIDEAAWSQMLAQAGIKANSDGSYTPVKNDQDGKITGLTGTLTVGESKKPIQVIASGDHLKYQGADDTYDSLDRALESFFMQDDSDQFGKWTDRSQEGFSEAFKEWKIEKKYTVVPTLDKIEDIKLDNTQKNNLIGKTVDDLNKEWNAATTNEAKLKFKANYGIDLGDNGITEEEFNRIKELNGLESKIVETTVNATMGEGDEIMGVLTDKDLEINAVVNVTATGDVEALKAIGATVEKPEQSEYVPESAVSHIHQERMNARFDVENADIFEHQKPEKLSSENRPQAKEVEMRYEAEESYLNRHEFTSKAKDHEMRYSQESVPELSEKRPEAKEFTLTPSAESEYELDQYYDEIEGITSTEHEITFHPVNKDKLTSNGEVFDPWGKPPEDVEVDVNTDEADKKIKELWDNVEAITSEDNVVTFHYAEPESNGRPETSNPFYVPSDQVYQPPVQIDTTQIDEAQQKLNDLNNTVVEPEVNIQELTDIPEVEEEVSILDLTDEPIKKIEDNLKDLHETTTEPEVDIRDLTDQPIKKIDNSLTELDNSNTQVDVNPASSVAATVQALESVRSALAQISALKNQTINITKNVTTTETIAPATDTKQPSKATGTIGLAKAQGTLMGELGPELYVSNGRYFVAGQNGPEFVNLASDAIVFNHLQTEQLLKYGMSSTRGQAVTNERNAVAFASGNVNGGPAMASASAALAALKQLRAQWQAIANMSAQDFAGLGGSGGGGGGGKNDPARKAWIEAVERWYNLMQKIAQLEKDITHEESLRTKLSSDWQKNGKAYYESQKRSLQAIEQQMIAQTELNISKQDYFKQRREQLNSYGAFKDMYQFDKNGQLKYQDGAYEYLSNLVARDFNNVPLHDLEEQYNMLISRGYGAQMRYTSSGEEIKRAESKDGEPADQSDFYQKSIQALWDQIEAEKNEMQSLHDDIEDGEVKVLGLENDRNEILKEIRDNQIDLENKMLNAIVQQRQDAIDKLSEERQALEESTGKYIQGLSDALSQEKQMYENQQNEEELLRMRRQLAILQRSGAGASQINSLQDQIRSKEQDQYFNYQQQQIDKIQEASDLEIERLDTQIDLMTTTLEYEKENGLLWGQVYDYLFNHSAVEISDYISMHDQELWGASPLRFEDSFQQTLFGADQWIAFRNDQNTKYDALYAKTADQQTISDAVYGASADTDWKVFDTAMSDLYGTRWDSIADDFKDKFFTDYSNSGDITRASTNITTALTSLGSSLTSAINSANASSYSGGGGGSSGGGGSGGGGGATVTSTSGWKWDDNSHWKVQTLSNGSTKIVQKSAHSKKSDYRPGVSYNWCTVCGWQKNINTNTGKVILATATGNALAQGTLMGELGPEVYVSGGKVHVAGVHGAEMVNLPNDAIVFNHIQSRGLMATGHTGRGTPIGTEAQAAGYHSLPISALSKGFFDHADSVHTVLSALAAGTVPTLESMSPLDSGDNIIIENATVEMHIDQISNDYDARRAGEQALSEMMRIARKTSAKNSVGR